MPYRRASFAFVKRRRLGLAFGAAAAIAVGAVAIAAGAGDSRPDALAAGPTWRDVAPVFAEKCAGCHTPGGIAPFSLRNARTAAAHADAILVMTELGRMPPWIAAWVPGHATNDLPQGTGVLVHSGALIVMQVHYNLMHDMPGMRMPDRSKAKVELATFQPSFSSPRHSQ